MNDQLQKALTDILAVLTEGAKVAGSAAVTQLPLLIREYLRWGLVSSCMGVVEGLIVLVIGLVLVRWGRKGMNDSDSPMEVIVLIFGILAAFRGWCFTVHCIYTLTHILVAPRTYLLDLVREMAGR